MDFYLFICILFGIAALYVTIGYFSSRQVHTTDDYYLANRSLGIFSLTFTLIATQLGSGMLLGTAEKAYQIGFWGLLYTLGMASGFMILSLGFASRMRSLNIKTTAEVFEKQYQSVNLKSFASLLSIISLCGLFIGQIIASKQLLIGLGVYNPYLMFCFWLFIIIYTMMGGLQSVVLIDTLQVGFIITVFSGIFFGAMWKYLPILMQYKTLTLIQSQFKTSKLSIPSLLPTFLMPVMFSLIEQDLAQRFFAAKTKFTARMGAFFASLCMIAFACIPLSFGIMAKLNVLPAVVSRGGNPLIAVITKVAPPWIFILATCAIIAAITSTADSLLCAISSNIAQDFNHYFKNPIKLSQAKKITFATGLIALFIAYSISTDIISILENSYRISVSCLFVPTIAAYFSNHLNKKAALLSIIGGAIGFALYFLLPVTVIREVIPVAISLLGYIIGSFL